MSLTSNTIALNEQKARSKHLAALANIDNDTVSDNFNDLLETNLLPLLVRVGFDSEIAGNIFRISAPAWQSMGPVPGSKLRLHPALSRDIKEIRCNFVSKAKNVSETPSFASSPLELAEVEKAMHPNMLPELLQAISTSWIVLPRAHLFLTKDDSHYLIVYLQHLDRETNLAFQKILARILIEFIGNYSLKFINTRLPEKKMMEAIFYGYVAMFWKNLRQPPLGMEDLLISNNYLSWAKAFSKRALCKDIEKEEAVAEMEEMQNDILPDRNINTLPLRKVRDAGSLHITLRHGRPGVSHAVGYFTLNATSLRGRNYDPVSYTTLPRQFNALCRELRNSYSSETPRTRECIREFVMELGSACSQRAPRPNLPGHNIPADHSFAHRRMARMLHEFNQSLH